MSNKEGIQLPEDYKDPESVKKPEFERLCAALGARGYRVLLHVRDKIEVMKAQGTGYNPLSAISVQRADGVTMFKQDVPGDLELASQRLRTRIVKV